MAKNVPEVRRDDPVHEDGDQVVCERLLAKSPKRLVDAQPGKLDQRAVDERQEILYTLSLHDALPI